MLILDALRAGVQHGATAGVAAAAGVIALLLAGIAHRIHRDPIAALTLSVIATVFVAVAGLLAVPGARVCRTPCSPPRGQPSQRRWPSA
ncbi:hypothetical protein BZL30_7875 [Mycobacterium kansasii]|uniref:EccD-like transmembrane domain-containing protein n=1 Tax=Mycobacterium kansasii TaxID=1768 RepID=A0A1V3WM26_MYCKA|nr:hypothetical protein BZL30_7875 [Mycobacterium kansasii]